MPSSIESQIERAVEELLRGKVVDTVPQFRAETVLTNLAHRVKQDAEINVLNNLLTVEDVARQLGVSSRRVLAKAKWLREHGYGAGWQVPGTNPWLFRPEEMENLKPLPARRPRNDEK
jgi:hypothetical protein